MLRIHRAIHPPHVYDRHTSGQPGQRLLDLGVREQHFAAREWHRVVRRKISAVVLQHRQTIGVDEPTRGIDVGAKYEIYTIINRLASEGKGIVVVSSELPEILGLCDRIYVMSEGKIIAEMPAAKASQEAIMTSIMQQQEQHHQHQQKESQSV